jgi:hypothetical protein
MVLRALIAAMAISAAALGGAAIAAADPPVGGYKNCKAAAADGASDIKQGDPGYAPRLDRDGDGVGCES